MEDTLVKFKLSYIGKVKSSFFFCDSHTIIQISRNLVHHKQTEHIEVHIHFIRELV